MTIPWPGWEPPVTWQDDPPLTYTDSTNTEPVGERTNIEPVTEPFVTKDSGKREEYASGMRRDTQDGKARHDLLYAEGVPYKGQFLTRVAELLDRGAEKYGARNWEKATGDDEMARFKASAARHLAQWMAGDIDEDHAAAVVFNLMAYETTKWKTINHGPSS